MQITSLYYRLCQIPAQTVLFSFLQFLSTGFAEDQKVPRIAVELVSFDKSHLVNIGEIPRGETTNVVLDVSNATHVDLELVRISTSCGCIIAKSELGSLPPSGKMAINLQIRPEGGDIRQQLSLIFRGSNQTAVFEVAGQSVDRFSISPNSLFLKRDQEEYEAEINASFGDSLEAATCSLKSSDLELLRTRFENGKIKINIRASVEARASISRGGASRIDSLYLNLANGDSKVVYFYVASALAATVIPREIEVGAGKQEIVVFKRDGSKASEQLRLRSNGQLLAEGVLVRQSKSLSAYRIEAREKIAESVLSDVEEWNGTEWVQIGVVLVSSKK